MQALIITARGKQQFPIVAGSGPNPCQSYRLHCGRIPSDQLVEFIFATATMAKHNDLMTPRSYEGLFTSWRNPSWVTVKGQYAANGYIHQLVFKKCLNTPCEDVLFHAPASSLPTIDLLEIWVFYVSIIGLISTPFIILFVVLIVGRRTRGEIQV
jgi:hypothetical protein